jgi:hypothetical protein
VVRRPGFQVQANADIALARRGSPHTRLDLLRTMLDPAALRQIFILTRRGGPEQPDEALVVTTVVNTLKAVVELHRRRPEVDLSVLGPALDGLAQDPNPAVRAEAQQALLALRPAQ